MMVSSHENPRLRPVQPHFVEHNGRASIVLRDPLQLTEDTLLIPAELGPLLALCDGTRDVSALRAALVVHAGLNLSADMLAQIIAKLDESFLLANDRYRAAKAAAVERYRAAPSRALVSAGSSYPTDPDEARAMLDSFIDALSEDAVALGGHVRGVICPHIDYPRGGAIYARTWQAVAEAARNAEQVILFGTDHTGSEGQVTPTRQNYATPWGVFPTDQAVVDALAEVIGEEAAFAEELHHIGEHSIELALVWLHHIRSGEPCTLVPILCGSFETFTQGLMDPAGNSTFEAVLDVLRKAATAPSTLVVAAADLAHVGPAFGDMLPYDYVAQMRLERADETLIERMEQGDAEGFFAAIRAVENKYKVCGLPPIYLAMRLLGSHTGQRLGYQQCPADERDASWVSICGMALE